MEKYREDTAGETMRIGLSNFVPFNTYINERNNFSSSNWLSLKKFFFIRIAICTISLMLLIILFFFFFFFFYFQQRSSPK